MKGQDHQPNHSEPRKRPVDGIVRDEQNTPHPLREAVGREELLPCPFCGGEPRLTSRGYCGYKCSKRDHLIWAYGATDAEARANWNRRALLSSGVNAGVDPALGWPISEDGPHEITEHRRWLARQLLDSKLDEDEALGIVAHSPAITPALQPHPGAVEIAREALKRIEARNTGTIPAKCGEDWLDQDVGTADGRDARVALEALSALSPSPSFPEGGR